ncbi:hypothetical protein SADUNF_Sadunf02G0150400 [Salix dunnii]|uniref:RRM domain-containing protein n=1 Tax=Salix dunnii TaxID=1413687 RepID=A0A835N8D3_9ROSI|nr:hypothetical protein SADUNF_Sadunf02G0150400 [Salix dunnii]
MFKSFGSVLSVEVSRDPGTGVSRGCGYIMMSSIESARNAVSALDGSDVGGREMRVRYSFEMSYGRRNPEALNSAPTTHFFYESSHKLYKDLRNLFKRDAAFSMNGTDFYDRVLVVKRGVERRPRSG